MGRELSSLNVKWQIMGAYQQNQERIDTFS